MSKTTEKTGSGINPLVLYKDYQNLLTGIGDLFAQARRASAKSVNAILTAFYWETGRRIVEFEQHGRDRAAYGEQLLQKLSLDLTSQFGRGFGPVNISQMRKFYICWPSSKIFQTVPEKSGSAEIIRPSSEISLEESRMLGPSTFQTLSEKFNISLLATCFPLSWSAYVRLLSVKDDFARHFYETEALRGGWSIRHKSRRKPAGWIGPLRGKRRCACKIFSGRIAEQSHGR